ncbi:MAG: putative glycoside hydrolase [Candidatus Zambryskibacteria bacterium]|nr:putative glycoside hydrolase [Candidatus Zambryskibacteria bacterium]
MWTGGTILLFIFTIQFVVPYFFQVSYSAPAVGGELFASAEGDLLEMPTRHLETPEPLKALYMTSCVAATPSWRTSLKELIERTELNAVVIDIKDYTGRVSFANNFPKTSDQKGCVVEDFKEFIAELHASGIYVIGRISVFQDVSYTQLFPDYAVKSLSTGGVWKDHKGLSFVDVGAKPYWDYILEISNQAYELGFDELNYDYIRYPSDGNMKDTNYTWSNASSVSTSSPQATRSEVLESFFAYLYQNLKDTGVKTSADIFGMTTTIENDMGIGQVLEKALPHFDYVAPMVYPSHYPAGWNGFANPAEYPYEVIKIAMQRGFEREVALNIANGLATSTPSKLRPWLQDFNLGAVYGPDKVRAQMQATYDVGLTSWMIWSAANRYTEASLLPE